MKYKVQGVLYLWFVVDTEIGCAIATCTAEINARMICSTLNNSEELAKVAYTYGFCPVCKGRGITRERRPDGNDRCINGHSYKSTLAITER